MRKKSFFESLRHIHFIGIGGISMSALAKLCISRGIKVSGSDKTKSHITEELEHLGARVFYNHKKTNLITPDLVVYTSAISEQNPELMFAKKNFKTLERSDFCGLICKEFKTVIAVSGTHGKTTTTGMISAIFTQAGLNPTTLVGGEDINLNGNIRIGSNDFLITEACEYKAHFLKFEYNTAVVTNIEYDHPDYYHNEKELISSFKKFIQKSKNNVVVDEKIVNLLGTHNYITCSLSGNSNFLAKNICYYNGQVKYDCFKDGNFFARITLKVIGNHNISNSLYSIAVADFYNIPKKDIVDGLKEFSGIKRRMEYLGKINNNFVFADYAHHPTEILASLETLKQVYKKQLFVLFQPHTYSRTKYLMSGFISSLKDVDKLIILPTFSAREKPIKRASAKMLYSNLKFVKNDTLYLSSNKSISKEILKVSNHIIIFVGAGDIYEKAKEIVRSNKLS